MKCYIWVNKAKKNNNNNESVSSSTSKNCYVGCIFLFLILLIQKQQCAIFLSIDQKDTHTETILY